MREGPPPYIRAPLTSLMRVLCSLISCTVYRYSVGISDDPDLIQRTCRLLLVFAAHTFFLFFFVCVTKLKPSLARRRETNDNCRVNRIGKIATAADDIFILIVLEREEKICHINFAWETIHMNVKANFL